MRVVAVEDVDHLFFTCGFATEVCGKVLQKLKLGKPWIDGVELWWRWMICVLKGKSLTDRRLRASFAALIYSIWGERNARVFLKISSTPEVVSRKSGASY